MSVSVRAGSCLALLLAIAVDQPECDAQVVKAVRAKAAVAKEAGPPPADALKPANKDAAVLKAEAEEARRQKAAEQANLDLVAGGLRVLFGGAPAEVAAEVMIVDDQQAGADMQVDAMTQQFVMQLHPVLRSELGFVRLICSDLTPEQRKKIRTPAEAALKQAAKQLARHQNQLQRGMGRNAPTESSKLIREAIRKALQEALTEQQFARYVEESNQRTTLRKRAAISCLVSRLDGQLYLTPEQREKITESVSSKWQDGWEKWLTMMNMYGDRYFPTVPDQCITPFLIPEQKVVWQTVQKVDFSSWWGGGMQQNLDSDGWWGDDPANNAADGENGVFLLAPGGF